MDGSRLTAEWMDATFRVFRRIDLLMPQWADMVLKRLLADNRIARGPAPTLALVYHRLLRMVLCDATELRIVNGTVYFLRNDVACMQLRQFSDDEADALLRGWFHIFGRRVTVGAGHDYSQPLHPRIVDAHFPRQQLAARFMCTQLRADITAACGSRDLECVYGFGVYYAFVDAVSLLLLDEQTRAAGALLHGILMQRHAQVFTAWDDARELYPGHKADAELARAPKKTPHKSSKTSK